MAVKYRRDETGKLVAFNVGLIGCRTDDDARSDEEDFHRMMLRRGAELPQKRPLTARQRDANEFRLGWRAVDGVVLCPECQTENRPDSDYCKNDGAKLVALEGYQGVQDGETLKCSLCDRYNLPDSNCCTGCGHSLAPEKAEKASKWRSRLGGTAPRRFQQPTPAPRKTPAALHSYVAHGTRLVARETFAYVNEFGRKVNVKAGRTYVDSGSDAYKLRPGAFVAA